LPAEDSQVASLQASFSASSGFRISFEDPKPFPNIISSKDHEDFASDRLISVESYL